MTAAARSKLLVAGCLLFLLSLPFVTTRIYASDETQFFSWLPSWAFDRDVDFENQYRYFRDEGGLRDPLFSATFLERVNEIGRLPNFAPIGCAVLWSPFYAAGHVVALATGAPANGVSHPYIAAVAYGSATYGLLAILLSADIARRVVGRGTAAALTTWIGTPLVYYMYVSPPFAHAPSAFAVSLFVWTWLRVRHAWTPRAMIALGVTGAMMAMVRDQDAFFVIGPAIDYLRALVRTARAEPQGQRARLAGGGFVLAAMGAASFLLAYTPQLLAFQALNGHPSQTVLVARKMTWTSPHALDVLFSLEHGLAAWTPLAIVALGGLVWLALQRRPWPHPDARWIGVVALAMVAGQVYISGVVESWTVAGSFGQRRFVNLTPLLTLGLATIFVASTGHRAARAGLAVVMALSIWWNIGLMAQFGLHRMDRQRLTLGENARQTFVVLPRELPSLVYRYLTDRSSFYRLQRQ